MSVFNEDTWKDILKKKKKSDGIKKDIKQRSFLHLLQSAKFNSSVHFAFEHQSIYIL